MRSLACRTAALLVLLPARPALAESTGGPRITIGPNMLVSRDGDFPHVELQVAANPKDAKNLVGGAITFTRPNGGFACRTYATQDGGATWRASEFAEQMEWGGGDPYATFTPQGTAVFCALTMAKDEKESVRAFLHVWRSEDGGRTWAKPADLGYSYDYQKMTADQTSGRFAGRLYIAALHGYPEYLVSVQNSPIYFLNRIQTSMIIQAGANDMAIVPYSDQVFAGMKRLNKDVTYLRYGGEGHVLAVQANLADYWNRVIRFLEDKLKGDAAAEMR